MDKKSNLLDSLILGLSGQRIKRALTHGNFSLCGSQSISACGHECYIHQSKGCICFSVSKGDSSKWIRLTIDETHKVLHYIWDQHCQASRNEKTFNTIYHD